MINYTSNMIPMMTQPIEEFSVNDSRFTKVKIWLMHTGLNLNGSIFNKDVIQKAIPTLSNTPIVGSVTFYENGEAKDFEGHEIDLKITEDGDIKLINKTIPYGVIPQDNQAKFEKRLCDDGIEREYLTCEGLLWNKWEDATDILWNKAGVTGQSMELSNEYSGKFSDGKFEFTDFKFNGACLLGSNEMPAMINSTVEMVFSADAKSYIDKKMQEYTELTFTNNEGGKILKDNKEQTEFARAKKVVEESVEETVVNEPVDIKSEIVKEEDVTNEVVNAKEAENAEEVVTDVKPEEQVAQVIVEEQETIEAAHKEIREEIDNGVSAVDQITVSDQVYTIADIEALIADKERLEKELFTIKKDIHEKEVKSLFSTYGKHLDADELEGLQVKAEDLSIDELKVQLFSVIGMKSINKEINTDIKEEVATSFTAVKVSHEDEKPADKYADLFSKYLNK